MKITPSCTRYDLEVGHEYVKENKDCPQIELEGLKTYKTISGSLITCNFKQNILVDMFKGLANTKSINSDEF